MSHAITEGKDRELPPDRHGEIVRAPTPAAIELKTEILEASAYMEAGLGQARRERSSIESRTDLRLAATNEAMRADPARSAITLAIERETACRWAELDVSDFGRVRSDTRREHALEAIAGHVRASPEYADEIKKRSPVLAESARALNEERARVERDVAAQVEQQRRDGEKLAQRIEVERAETPHRYELYDWNMETTYRFPTAEAAVVKADELGVGRFQYRDVDGSVKQVDKIEGQWWVRQDPLKIQDRASPAASTDRPLASVQETIDREALRSIEDRAGQRSSVGQGVDAKTDRQMATVDAFAFRRIQDPALQENAAVAMADSARQYPNYKEGLDKATPGYPGTAQKVYALDTAHGEKLADNAEHEAAAQAARQQRQDDIAAAAKSREASIKAAALAALGDARARETARVVEQLAGSPETATRELREAQQAFESPPLHGRATAPDDPELAARGRAIKRPVSEDELSPALLTRYIVSHGKRSLLDKGSTEFTLRNGGQQGRVAFVDVGKSLSTERDDKATIRAMVEVASAKNWKEITVSGSDDFRRNAWVEASLNGMQVRGYEPREADKQLLAELQQSHKPTNVITAVEREHQKEEPREPATPAAEQTQPRKHIDGDALTAHEKTVLDNSRAILNSKTLGDQFTEATLRELEARLRGERIYVGEIVDHGKAPYRFDKKNDDSYYVILNTRAGEQVIWGKGLAEAMQQRRAGEQIVLKNIGKRDVTVQERVRDALGQVVATRPKESQLNAWKSELLSRYSEKARADFATRSTTRRPSLGVYDAKASRAPAQPAALARTHEQRRSTEQQRKSRDR